MFNTSLYAHFSDDVPEHHSSLVMQLSYDVIVGKNGWCDWVGMNEWLVVAGAICVLEWI